MLKVYIQTDRVSLLYRVVKSIISRKNCINVGFDICRKLFDYAFKCIEQNIESISVNTERGNAYTHLLNNGLEILRRLVSVSSLVQQKKLLTLMAYLKNTNMIKMVILLNLSMAKEQIKEQSLTHMMCMEMLQV